MGSQPWQILQVLRAVSSPVFRVSADRARLGLLLKGACEGNAGNGERRGKQEYDLQRKQIHGTGSRVWK